MSAPKPIFASSVQPLASIVSGSARKVCETKPPKVSADHSATKATKKATPSATFAPAPTGARGFTGPGALLDEPGVGQLRHVGRLLDDPRLEQQLGRLLRERRVLAG